MAAFLSTAGWPVVFVVVLVVHSTSCGWGLVLVVIVMVVEAATA
jgi:hypothetical protein